MAKGTLGELNIQIAANVAQLSQDVTKVERELRKMRAAGVKTSRDMDRAAKSIDGFKNLAKNITAAVIALKSFEVAGRFLIKTTENAALLEQGVMALNTQVQSLGLTGTGALDKLRETAQGLVDDKTLVEMANRAISLGIKFEDLAGFMEIARAKARDMGTDTKTAFGDLVTALGRVSPMILDNLGITVKVGEANEKYAASIGKTVSQLTEQEKKMAFQKAALEAGREATARHNLATQTSAEKMQAAKVAIDNLALAAGGLLSPVLVGIAEDFTSVLEAAQKLFNFLDKDALKITKKFAEENIVDPLGGALTWVSRLVDKADAALDKIIPGRSGWANPQTGQRRLSTDEMLAKGEEERRQEVLDREVKLEKARGDAIVSTRVQENTRILEQQIEDNQKWIAQQQKALQVELEIELQNERAEENIHKRAMERKKAEFDLDQAALEQKREAIRAIVQAAATAEQAGLTSFQTQKRIAAALALVNAYLAISQVWAEKSNSVYETVAKVAYTAGQVFSVVSALRSVNVGSSGGGGLTPGSAPIFQAGQDSLLAQDQALSVGRGTQTTIVFQGGTFIGGDKDAVARDLVPAINKAISDNG